MSSDETHGTVSADGLYVDFQAQMHRALPRKIERKYLLQWKNRDSALREEVREMIERGPDASQISARRKGYESRPKKPIPKRTYRILRPVAPAPAAPRTFRADETFFNKKNASGVKMVEHGSDFTTWFSGKIEENPPDGTLVPFTLTTSIYDKEIIADLGGKEHAEVTLSEIWRLMELQPNGQAGKLLTNGWANIFYVTDVNGVLRAVYVGWYADGWLVHAFALDDGRWLNGSQVFSRNSWALAA